MNLKTNSKMEPKNKEKAVKKVKPTQVTNPYTKIGKNIYRTGTSYRVRVAGVSNYCHTKKEALAVRKYMLDSTKVNN